jgi:hypothetical protein
MPGPIVTPCGGNGQPACPPTSAIKRNPLWQYGTDDDGNFWVCKIQGEHIEHVWERVIPDTPSGDDGPLKRYRDTNGHSGAL